MATVLFGLIFALVGVAALLLAWLIVLVRRQSDEIDRRVRKVNSQLKAVEQLRKWRASGTDRRAGLPAGSILNDFELPNLHGGAITFSQWRGQKIGVLFVRPTCAFSVQLVAALKSTLERDDIAERQLIVVSTGGEPENRELIAGLPRTIPLLVQFGSELARVWRVPVTPSLYLIDEAGVTESNILHGQQEILPALGLSEIAPGGSDTSAIPGSSWKSETTPYDHHHSSTGNRLKPGDQIAPELLRKHLGQVIDVVQRHDRSILLLSDTRCEPCRSLTVELEPKFDLLPNGLGLIKLTQGDPASQGAFVVVHQTDASFNRAVGMLETPCAILIDRNGFVIEPLAVGSAAVLELVKRTIGVAD